MTMHDQLISVAIASGVFGFLLGVFVVSMWCIATRPTKEEAQDTTASPIVGVYGEGANAFREHGDKAINPYTRFDPLLRHKREAWLEGYDDAKYISGLFVSTDSTNG